MPTKTTLDRRGRVRGPHRGKTLVMFALLLPVLLGVLGLVIDSGLLMAAQRQAQNAADAAATAAAMDLYRGSDAATATATANTFVTNNANGKTGPTNVLAGVVLTLGAGTTNAINIPPTIGPHAGDAKYVEAYVTVPISTTFIQVLGINQSQKVTARAVAGYEPVGAGEGVFVLDPTAAPGLSIVNNNTRLVVNGDITVNSAGSGVDQFGSTVTSALNADAVKTSNSVTTPAPIVASTLNVVGGVTNLDNIRAYDPAFGPTNLYDAANTDRPVIARVPIAPDPLLSLATPTTSSVGTPVQLVYPDKTGANTGFPPKSISLGNNDTVTLVPGIYSDISIGNGASVTFSPGIYVFAPPTNTTNTLKITGGTISGNGVMFYNTGSDYNPATGAPDNTDGNSTPNPPAATKFGAFQITGGTINLVPLIDANSPFNGILFYQRRWNINPATVGGSGGNLNLQGTLYAKWALFHLAGQGSFQAQFLVGSMDVSGGAAVTINATGKNVGKANLVFLVE